MRLVELTVSVRIKVATKAVARIPGGLPVRDIKIDFPFNGVAWDAKMAGIATWLKTVEFFAREDQHQAILVMGNEQWSKTVDDAMDVVIRSGGKSMSFVHTSILQPRHGIDVCNLIIRY